MALRSEAAVSALGIWLIERTDEYGYDEYDSAVVYAETDDEAREMHPNGYGVIDPEETYSSWTTLEQSHCSSTHRARTSTGALLQELLRSQQAKTGNAKTRSYVSNSSTRSGYAARWLLRLPRQLLHLRVL